MTKALKIIKKLMFFGLLMVVFTWGYAGINGTIRFFSGEYDGRPFSGVIILLVYVTVILSVIFYHVVKHLFTKH
jgi:magnesium-transporting ATPase (P-type)